MKENTLLKIAFVVAILGLVVLYLISGIIEVEQKDIDKITLGNVGEQIKVSGEVSSVKSFKTVTIIELKTESRIDVVLFKENVSLDNGRYVEIYGSVDEYEGKPEIIGETVRILS